MENKINIEKLINYLQMKRKESLTKLKETPGNCWMHGCYTGEWETYNKVINLLTGKEDIEDDE